MTLGSLDLLFSNLTVDMEASKEREGKSISFIKMCSLSGMSWYLNNYLGQSVCKGIQIQLRLVHLKRQADISAAGYRKGKRRCNTQGIWEGHADMM